MKINTEQRLLTPAEVAEFLGVPITTLWRWRQENRGPFAYKVGRVLRYDRDEVTRWLNAQRGL